MIAGYHTCGLLLHDVAGAIGELSRLGYGAIAIRPHAANFHPALPWFDQQQQRVAAAIAAAAVQTVIDLDAPYTGSLQRRWGPALVATEAAESEAALQWILQWVSVAERLGASLLTFSSGAGAAAADEATLERLSMQLNRLAHQTQSTAVRLAIRPRSGDAIATVAHFERLRQWLRHPANLGLAADVGEMLSGGELPVSDRLARNLDSLACVYLCDHRAGAAGDQRIGHGDVALTRILSALNRYGFSGPAIVRIEGHSELGFTPAAEAIEIFADAQR